MKPVEFDEQNIVFKKPEGWENIECDDLPACVDNINRKTYSCWELTDEELEKVKKTKKVWLAMTACPPCPAFLTVTNPIKPIIITVPQEKMAELNKAKLDNKKGGKN